MKTEAEITARLEEVKEKAAESDRLGASEDDLLPTYAVIDTLEWVLGIAFDELPPELAAIVEKAREGSVEWSGREGRPKRHTD